MVLEVMTFEAGAVGGTCRGGVDGWGEMVVLVLLVVVCEVVVMVEVRGVALVKRLGVVCGGTS